MEHKASLCSTWLRKLNESTAIATQDRTNLSRILTRCNPSTPEEFFKVKLVGGVVDKEPLLNFLSSCIGEAGDDFDTKAALFDSVRFFFCGCGFLCGRVREGCVCVACAAVW